jgi:hypothetical protein
MGNHQIIWLDTTHISINAARRVEKNTPHLPSGKWSVRLLFDDVQPKAQCGTPQSEKRSAEIPFCAVRQNRRNSISAVV